MIPKYLLSQLGYAIDFHPQTWHSFSVLRAWATSFDMLCNLPYIKMLTERVPLLLVIKYGFIWHKTKDVGNLTVKLSFCRLSSTVDRWHVEIWTKMSPMHVTLKAGVKLKIELLWKKTHTHMHSIIFQMKVLLNSFYLNGCTAGFHPVKNGCNFKKGVDCKTAVFLANASDEPYSNERSGASEKTARENGERR